MRNTTYFSKVYLDLLRPLRNASLGSHDKTESGRCGICVQNTSREGLYLDLHFVSVIRQSLFVDLKSVNSTLSLNPQSIALDL